MIVIRRIYNYSKALPIRYIYISDVYGGNNTLRITELKVKIKDKKCVLKFNKKSNITEEEYYKICDELEDKLYVGHCEWCV